MLNETAKLIVQLSAYIVLLEQTVQQLQTQLAAKEPENAPKDAPKGK